MAKKKTKKKTKKISSKQLVKPLKDTAASLKDASKAIKLAARSINKSIKIVCEQKNNWIKETPTSRRKKARKK